MNPRNPDGRRSAALAKPARAAVLSLPAGTTSSATGNRLASALRVSRSKWSAWVWLMTTTVTSVIRSSPGGGPTIRLNRMPYLMSGLSEKTGSVTSAFRPRRTRKDEWPSQKMPSPDATGTTRGAASAVRGAPATVSVSCGTCQASRCSFPEWKQASSTPQSATTPSARHQPRRLAGKTALRASIVRPSSPAFLERTALGIGITSCQTRDRAGAAHRSRLP